MVLEMDDDLRVSSRVYQVLTAMNLLLHYETNEAIGEETFKKYYRVAHEQILHLMAMEDLEVNIFKIFFCVFLEKKF